MWLLPFVFFLVANLPDDSLASDIAFGWALIGGLLTLVPYFRGFLGYAHIWVFGGIVPVAIWCSLIGVSCLLTDFPT
jgi:hypothetical protein